MHIYDTMAKPRRSSLFNDDDGHHQQDLLSITSSSSSSDSSSSGLSLTCNHQEIRNSRRRSSLLSEDDDGNNRSSCAELWHDELVCLKNGSDTNMISDTASNSRSEVPELDPLLQAEETVSAATAAAKASSLPFEIEENALFSTSAAAEAEACKHDATIAAM